jgi:hypothetical protein
MHISKQGDEYLWTLLVQGTHYILGPFGEDSDLRPRGTEARRARRKERQETSGGGGSAKARGTSASVVGQWRGLRTAAQWLEGDARSGIESLEPNSRARPPSLGDCDQLLAQTSLLLQESRGRLSGSST